jgi:eukaryotic-like serine/threonine-protein kinase
MALSVGDRFGPYEVVGALGAGGMGQVYRARDSRLGREVALKILSDLVARDPERIARFEREARTLASLSHPNIAGIHGLEDSGGVQALVLELVEGPTLADRLVHGPMAVDEALAVARQIADALEAAHEVGIIHRDLKPANIKLRPDGTVKVLDFGLAKAIAAAHGAEGPGGAANLSHSPTITGPIGMTGVGVLLGTAAYMPPEQARGKPVDKRADIWAFGCVLFEMLTARRCFDGEDVSLTLAEVIKSEPDWKALPAGTPAAVRSTLKQCLQKDPKRRIRDIGDVRLALDAGVGVASMPLHDRPASLPRRWSGAAAAGAIGIMLGALAAALMLRAPAPAPGRAPLIDRFSIALPPGSTFRDNIATPVALSSDGRRVVINVSSGGSDRVIVRALDHIQPQLVQGLEGVVGSIFLSPDGEWVAFNDSKGSMKRMRLAGGPALTITETGISGGGWQGATWGTAGTIVFSTSARPTLMEVSEAGGVPKPRTTAAENESHVEPFFLPDGRSLLFQIRRVGQPGQIAYLPGGATNHVLLLEGTDPRYVSSGHMLFAREASVWAVRFDLAAGRTIGDPVPVLEGVSISGGGDARASVSADGTLAYIAGGSGSLRTLVRVDRQGRAEALPGLTESTYEMIRVSPDGSRIAYTAGRPPNLWTYDLARGTSVRVTRNDIGDRTPLWTPDGLRLVFTAAREGRTELLVQNADGTGRADPFLAAGVVGNGARAEAWSADGKTLIVSEERGGLPDIRAVNVAGEPQPRELVATPSVDSAAALSPGGRWLAYQSTMSGVMEVYVERFPETGDRQKISMSGGALPRWSAKGNELFYQSNDGRRVFAVAVSAGTKFTAGTPTMLFEGTFVPTSPAVRGFDVTPDGRFVMLKPAAADEGAVATVVIVQNWFEELKRLVPTPALSK